MNDDDPIAAPSGRRLLSIAPTRMLESDVRRELSPVTISMTVIALFVGLAALNYGRVLLLPLATAILLNVVLRPLSRRMARIGVPYPVSALFLVGVIAGAIGLAGYGLSEPALQWLKEAPSSLRVRARPLSR